MSKLVSGESSQSGKVVSGKSRKIGSGESCNCSKVVSGKSSKVEGALLAW